MGGDGDGGGGGVGGVGGGSGGGGGGGSSAFTSVCSRQRDGHSTPRSRQRDGHATQYTKTPQPAQATPQAISPHAIVRRIAAAEVEISKVRDRISSRAERAGGAVSGANPSSASSACGSPRGPRPIRRSASWDRPYSRARAVMSARPMSPDPARSPYESAVHARFVPNTAVAGRVHQYASPRRAEDGFEYVAPGGYPFSYPVQKQLSPQGSERRRDPFRDPYTFADS